MSTNALKQVATGQMTGQQVRNPYDVLKNQLEKSKGEFKPVLGTEANVERFIRVVLNAVIANPELLEADRRSLLTACMKAALDGLMPDNRDAVLNIYNTKVKKDGRESWVKMAQYLPMVGGLIKKLYESGEVTYLDAAAVYANDRFVFRRGDDPKIEHEPCMGDDPGEIVAAYVVVKLKNGEIKREVMPRRDIEAVRKASKTPDKGPWQTWYDQQAIKSVIKRAYKQLPKTDALERIIAADNDALGFVESQGVGQMAIPTPPQEAEHVPALSNEPSESLEMDFENKAAEILASVAEAQSAEAVAVDDEFLKDMDKAEKKGKA